MKLKRFLALAVSLAMVLSMVPAFSLTASAASTTTVITALGGEVVWSAPDGNFFDTAIDSAFEGWTVTNNGGNVNVRTYGVGTTIQYYTNGVALNNTVTAPGYGDGAEKIILEWVHKTQIAPHGSGDLYFDFSFKDLNGTEIAFVQLDKNTSAVTGNYKMGYPVEGTGMAIVAYNNADGSTHTVEYYVGGSLVNTESAVAGTINGFKSITATNGRWSTAWNHMGFANLTIGTYTTPSGSDATTIKNALNKLEVAEVTKGEALVLPATATDALDTTVDVVWTSSDEAVIAADGTVTAGADLTVVTLTPTAEFGGETVTGTAHEVAVFPAVYTTEDAFTADGASYNVGEKVELSNTWYTRKSTAESTYEVTGLTEETVNGVKVTTLPGLGGAGSLGDTTINARTSIAVTPGQAYLLRFYYGGPELGKADGNMYNKVYTTATAYNDEVAIDYVSGTASASITTVANEWTEVEEIFVPSENANFLTFVYSWQAAGLKIADMELYTLVEDTSAVETLVSVADVAPVKVIGDTAVVLPATVKATGSLGSVVDATIAWDAPASYEVGTTTVSGVATVQFGEQEATTVDVSTTVTVLEETFTLSDLTSVNGQDAAKAAQLAFPVALTGEFSIEFNANYASFGDLFITLKTTDAGFFGPEQIALGVGKDTSGFRPVNGNGAGGRTVADYDHFIFTAGTDYRFFLTTSAATDKYTVTVYDAATGVELATAENYGYRTNADAIEVITALTNNGAGEVTLSNIKVNAPGVSKTEYTINITMDGETNTTTASFWSEAEALASIADVAGYEKTVAVEGTTINVVYAATQTLAATFIDANENVIKAVSEVVAIGETYTVAAEEIFFLDGDYNGYFYQIPETVLSADNNNVVVTVTETPNKYAVMEDMLVSDNEVWGMRATNSNSVFVAAGADANRGPVTDANGENAHDANHTPSTLGKSRVGFMQFPVVDVVEGQKVTANFYVREWHGNGFSNSNATLRLTAYAVNDDSWVALSDGGSYDSANAPIFEGYTNPVFSQVCYNNVGYITFDITEMMMAAKAAGLETITLRLNAPYGAAYIAEREACVVGGAYAGNAAYVLVEDANLVKVTETGDATLTKNGSDVNGVAYVSATDDVRLASTGAVVISTDAGYYYANTTMSITEATNFENTVPAGLGLAMVSGAQVRIGTTELEDGAKLDALADSGIRFLATANYTDTVLGDETVEFGIKVTAEASDKATYVPAVKFQDADETVFTAAITGLAESNYNRKFTAVAYAKVPMADGSVAEFTTDSVTRSVYQVSAGIMKNGSADAEGAAYTVDGVVKNILNAYVNQTGIRLTYTADGITVEEGKYTGDVFFTVESTVNEDGSVAVTITPDTTWGTPAEIAEWWTDYVRVNNNNSVAKTYISDAAVVDGVLTFTFTVPAAE